MGRRRFRRYSFYRDAHLAGIGQDYEPGYDCRVEVGQSVRNLREENNLSMRALADKCGLSVNTLSLIENGKTSPSVSTLQKISAALQIPMVAFFLSKQFDQKIVHTRHNRRKQAVFENGVLEDLGEGLSDGIVEPFIVTLEPQASSGLDAITHTGYEFIFCLIGRIAYIVDNIRYVLEPGDSLFFEANLPHCWQNLASEPSKIILILCPGDYDLPIGRHFNPDQG